jgi:hypothetical protein
MKYQVNTQFFLGTLMITIFVIFIPLYFFRKYDISLNDNLSTIVFWITSIVTYYLVGKLTSGKAVIHLTSTELKFDWIKKPIITFQESVSIDFDSISGWKYRKEHQYDYFKIYTINNEELLFYPKLGFNKKDDFTSFLAAFEAKIEDYNDKEVSVKKEEYLDIRISPAKKTTRISPRIVDKEKEFYNSGLSTFLYYVYILTFILCSIGLVTKWNKLDGSQPLLIISGLFGCLFLINQHRQKRKKQ